MLVLTLQKVCYNRKMYNIYISFAIFCNAFGHLIRAPHYFQSLGWIGFIYGLMIGIGPNVLRSVRVAERLALPTSDHGVGGSNPAGGEILPEPKRRFIAQSLSCSPFHRLEMTEILLKGRKTLTHPSIQMFCQYHPHPPPMA